MVRRVLGLGLAAAGIFVLSGCATMGKNDELSNQGLRNKVSALETQLTEKDNEISALKDELARKQQDAGADLQGAAEPKRIDAKMIQTALKNAGYFQNEIDGKMGRKTRLAVREFQKANNLHVDGRVGKNTWILLKEYLDKKVK
jgi:peptidoglycan hydrolase-like protein with peptidoglycan-binding domain